MKEAFKEACKHAIAAQAGSGFSADDVDVVLSLGSDTNVAYTTIPVPDEGPAFLENFLDVTSFQPVLVGAFSEIPNIDTVVTGDISINHLEASMVEGTKENRPTLAEFRRLTTLAPAGTVQRHQADWADGSGEAGPRHTLFLLGDSLAAALVPGVRAAVAGHFATRFFAVNGGNCWCGFMPFTGLGCLPPNAGLKQSTCYSFNAHATEIIERELQEGDVLAVAHYDRWGAEFIPHGELLPIADYVLHLKALQRLATRRGASLLLFGPLVILPVPGPKCVPTSFDPQAFRACEVLQEEEVKTHNTLNDALTELGGLTRTYLFSYHDLMCDGQLCGAFIPGTNILAYRDQMHLTQAASHYLAPFLCKFLTTHGLMPSL
jgi:hypothetical protein